MHDCRCQSIYTNFVTHSVFMTSLLLLLLLLLPSPLQLVLLLLLPLPLLQLLDNSLLPSIQLPCIGFLY
jgi:hypothetical protein